MGMTYKKEKSFMKKIGVFVFIISLTTFFGCPTKEVRPTKDGGVQSTWDTAE